MMPPYCPDDAPPGEKALFRALASSAETDGWIVLHSQAIASHVSQVEGEADFVVITPKHGMLVIEVKSHSSVKRSPDGQWKLGSQPPTSRSPFQQANESMHSIRNYLRSRNVDLHSVPVLNAVWFTSVRARTMLPRSPEWQEWQLLDSEDLHTGAVPAILRVIVAGIKHLESRVPGFSHDVGGLDDAAALRIANVLRPKFEAAIVPGDIRRARETQLATFTDEQYDALDNMQHNQAVLFAGPAGTGKTWLAMEATRREVAVGRTGRVLCFNRLLGQRLKQQLIGVEGVRIATFHEEALRLSGGRAPSQAEPDFWESDLPDRAIEALLDHGEDEAADFLIVDEIQDLAREPFIDVLEFLVEGGLGGGRVLLFGDFERQAIYERGDGRALLRDRIPGLTTFALTVNCRNLPRIGTVVKKLSHMAPGYRRFRRPDDGADPEFIPVPRGTDQSKALTDAVHMLRADGYNLDEIVVLSPLRHGATAETTTDPWLRQILQPADGQVPKRGRLRYSTIHAFKGLDAPAIIATDLDAASAPNFEALLYVGLTRATDRLITLIEVQTLRATYGGNA
ncbi:nuclease-related domain-containing DEAD/DEAH box helicase [Nocardia bhagyanarayanae]|uniref:AAA domain-containing protein n=1 Tax=Nocardia bhagyanarayanae TaxID=1215925 RepID=A0A543FBS0_9NOCA|nr:NERD domain-containing protein [Nocardia bhagyanarayanae]TQM31299.1 AAA domain-containing protein [Nocardia bhagyanarayanae]